MLQRTLAFLVLAAALALTAVVGWFSLPRGSSAGPERWSELGVAAQNGRTGEIARRVAAGADPNAFDDGPNGWTPLLHAIHAGQPASVRALLDAGADPDLPAETGSTPLSFAAAEGRGEIVEALLAAGADPARPGAFGWTPLQQAVSRGDDRTVRALLEADPGLSLGAGPRSWVPRAVAWIEHRDTLRLADGILVSSKEPAR